MSRSTAALAAALLAWPAASVHADTPPSPPSMDRLGQVNFPVSCAGLQNEFNRAVAMLHSFWFPPADATFRHVAAKDASCGMAWWGVAMVALGNPLAGAPTPQSLKLGRDAVEKAQAAGAKTERERDYIAAIAQFYQDSEKVPHRDRARAYEQAMERLAAKYPDDSEAKIFYGLSLNITFDPGDKSYKNQLKAAAILEPVFAAQPQHPGIAHYIIHSYDFPPIAAKGLDAAMRYAKIAPDAPHALHMPSHIFTRVGHWQDSIVSNRASAEIAQKEFAATGSANSVANAYHAYDYMAYAHLQLAQDKAAKALAEKILELKKIDLTRAGAPIAVTYALAAIPVRYVLEREEWAAAAKLELPAIDLPWQQFPHTTAIVSFARGVGAARSKDTATAERARAELGKFREALVQMKQAYWANQVEIQAEVVDAWIKFAAGKTDDGLAQMRLAAEWEAKTEKHPVTPGPIIPARELLGDMLMQAGQHKEALAAYEHSMRVEPNRFRGYAGAARAAELAGDKEKAQQYYKRLLDLAAQGDGDRPILKMARDFTGAK
jgi:tetratricopeptide (TPR) repeat protein